MTNKITASLIIGICAGVIDILPGVIQGIDFRITIAGFSFWVTNSIVIAYIFLPVKDWQKGILISSLLAIPGVALLSVVHPGSVIPMIILTFFLGAFVGHLNGKYAR